jgi:hypothetical protein
MRCHDVSIELASVNWRFRAELARQPEPRRFRRPDADHPPRAHLLRGGDRQNSDRTGALDHDGFANPPARVAR